MKGRLLALLLSLIVSGTAGLYAKNAAQTSDQSAPAASSAVTAVSPQSEAASAPSSQESSAVQSGSTIVSTQNSSCPTSYSPATKADTSSKASSSAASSQKSSTASGSTCNQNTYCNTNSTCASTQSGCVQNSCAPGTYQYCTPNYNCGQTGTNYSSYLNDVISRLTGKSCNQTPSGSASSKPATSAPSKSSSSGTPASSGSTATGTYADFQNQVLQLVNKERTSRGLNALSMDSALNKTATLKSQDMAKLGYFDHTSPTYGSPFDMMKQFGISYRTAGENIAMGQTSPTQVMNGWMNSEGHRANILNSSFTKIGIGVAQNSSGRYYWTQQFIG
ncbi:CAP domain-containing protein [Caproicibacter sp.]|uniref:CAP domain-containing protein n=1 Tax=Caproicibacter sp. TaxID=2814884 RepID=UPI0039899D56